MVGNVDVGGVTIPVLGVIWLASLVIVIFYFAGVSLGIITFLSWIVFLAGVVVFIFWAASHFFS